MSQLSELSYALRKRYQNAGILHDLPITMERELVLNSLVLNYSDLCNPVEINCLCKFLSGNEVLMHNLICISQLPCTHYHQRSISSNPNKITSARVHLHLPIGCKFYRNTYHNIKACGRRCRKGRSQN